VNWVKKRVMAKKEMKKLDCNAWVIMQISVNLENSTFLRQEPIKNLGFGSSLGLNFTFCLVSRILQISKEAKFALIILLIC